MIFNGHNYEIPNKVNRITAECGFTPDNVIKLCTDLVIIKHEKTKFHELYSCEKNSL